MKRNFIRLSLLGMAVALCGGIALSSMSGGVTKAPEAELIANDAEVEKTATWDFGNKAVMDETIALSGSAEAGTVKAAEDNGVEMTVISNGATFRNNGNNIQVRKGAEFRVPVVTTEDIVTVKGFPGYSYYSISDGEENQNNSDNPTTTYKAKNSDVQRGYVTVVSTNDNNYYYSITVEQMKPRQLLNLDNEAATATFKFDQGTEGQKATFSEADYFISSKVTYGSNLVLEGKDNKDFNQTWFNPNSKDGSANDGNVIRFAIQPRFGIAFSPTKVSFKASRFGTDGGYIDVAWANPDGTLVTLASSVKPPRDNASPSVGEYSYDVTGAVAAEGQCALVINLYGLDHNKRIGFSDIVIEGTLSGQEKEVPILDSFTANEKNYVVEDIFEPDGENYTATIELFSTETMISADNPISDIKTLSGTVGEVTYSGDADKCTATIPVTSGDITINYLANFVRKPLFTLTYVDTDGTDMGTQKVEKDTEISHFDIDFATAKAKDGYKVRGWFSKPTESTKITTSDIVTGDMKLYALQSEIEVASTSRKYTFNLASPFFYPEDHEAFNTEAGYFHDKTHGWAFKPGDEITLLVGPKASVSISLCRYGYGTTIDVIGPDGKAVCDPLPGKSQDETDGALTGFEYEGEPGYITLKLNGDGEMYFHNMKIVNNSEVSYNKVGQWYFVTPGDVWSLYDALDDANVKNSAKDAPRTFIYLPNGTYDMDETALTQIAGNNISLIGQSHDGVLVKNAPSVINEGINTTATFLNTGSNNYIQDMTIQNALDYYNAGSAGRAVVLQDRGTRTIGKNISMLSYQDTYYSNNDNGEYYFEDSKVAGTVDFLCGSGTMFMENCTIIVEKRQANGKGGCTLTAAATAAGKQYGYVFDNCTIENYAENYNLGRAWQSEPRVAYINTTVSDSKMVDTRWTSGGMNTVAKEFVEFNTKDLSGKVVSPASHVMSFTYNNAPTNKMETILTAEQAANYAVDKVFTDWDPVALAKQVDAPEASYANGEITWTAVEGAIAYALFCNDELVTITSETSYKPENVGDDDIYTIRSVNSMGGMGTEAPVDGLSSIEDVNAAVAEEVGAVYYNIQGMKVDASYKGVVIKKATLSDGSVVTSKVINR